MSRYGVVSVTYPYYEMNPSFRWKSSRTGRPRVKHNKIRVYYGGLNAPQTREEACKLCGQRVKEWHAACKKLGRPPGVED